MVLFIGGPADGQLRADNPDHTYVYVQSCLDEPAQHGRALTFEIKEAAYRNLVFRTGRDGAGGYIETRLRVLDSLSDAEAFALLWKSYAACARARRDWNRF